jgi:hypothetical protein
MKLRTLLVMALLMSLLSPIVTAAPGGYSKGENWVPPGL